MPVVTFEAAEPFRVHGENPGTRLADLCDHMGPMSSQPPSVSQTATAAPLSQSPAAAAAGGDPVGAGSFVDRLAMLLQALMPQSQQAGAPAASADQPGATPPASADAEAANSLIAAMSGASAAPPQIGPLAAAITLQTSDAGSAQPRDGGGSKPKALLATPTRRTSAMSSQRATIPDAVVLAASDSPVALPAPPPAMSDLEVRRNVALHRTSDKTETGGVAGTQLSSSVGQKAEEPIQAASEPPPQESALPRMTVAELTTNALPSPPLGAAAPPAHPAETSATAPHGQPTSPSVQIAPVLMQVRHTLDGSQQLTVRLDPPELGHLQVKIERPSDAAARVEITVEKPETLILLLRDQVQLQRALDQAGVPADGRNVTFHIAPPEAPLRNDPGTAPVANTASGGPTGDSSQGAAHQHPKSARQRHDTADDSGAEFTSIAASRWMRAGLDITA